ncbi:hypothetical protein Y032_0089g2233 [Ancylostoma ceylanicum]|uniref:Uncharacterized protein n=1 Tax=Ancylostoma ceylanicum TaxID=53326 RepID=A0A016TN60_9BILA|nr:hypothetical protein Y032_0089g2233 [Ancylostoma ceylanicum]
MVETLQEKRIDEEEESRDEENDSGSGEGQVGCTHCEQIHGAVQFVQWYLDQTGSKAVPWGGPIAHQHALIPDLQQGVP